MLLPDCNRELKMKICAHKNGKKNNEITAIYQLLYLMLFLFSNSHIRYYLLFMMT